MLLCHTNLDRLNPYPAALALQDPKRHLLECLHAMQVPLTQVQEHNEALRRFF